ncbi:hypothetical protein ACC756_27960 [Rhizobium ruizarguesonis]
MFDTSVLVNYLRNCKSAEEAFPVCLHSGVPREMRLYFLRALGENHRVYRNPENAVKYVLDLSIARELFAHPTNAVRYTALLTDVQSSEVDEIEDTLRYFPVFSDEAAYQISRKLAAEIRSVTEGRLERLRLRELIAERLRDVLIGPENEVDLLSVILSINAEISIRVLSWEGLLTGAELERMSGQIFSMFDGRIAKLLSADEVHQIYLNMKRLSDENLLSQVWKTSIYDDECRLAMPAILAQWITGFMSPCVTWIVYTFLRRFNRQITVKHGNYDSGPSDIGYMKSCLRDFIPFQAIHRLVVRDCEIKGENFHKGDFVCIVPDALGIVPDEHFVASVIGAPNRPCMGMNISTKIVDAYDTYFSARANHLSSWQIAYELVPSLSSLSFNKVILRR